MRLAVLALIAFFTILVLLMMLTFEPEPQGGDDTAIAPFAGTVTQVTSSSPA
jgi:hypothetical protein